MELLLLSSSRTTAGYFTEYLAEIKDFSAGTRRAVFLPFAAVALPWSEYAAKVSEAIGLALQPVEELDDWLRISGSSIELRGAHPAVWFHGEKVPIRIQPGGPTPFGDSL
jgi:Peptidase family S51